MAKAIYRSATGNVIFGEIKTRRNVLSTGEEELTVMFKPDGASADEGFSPKDKSLLEKVVKSDLITGKEEDEILAGLGCTGFGADAAE